MSLFDPSAALAAHARQPAGQVFRLLQDDPEDAAEQRRQALLEKHRLDQRAWYVKFRARAAEMGVSTRTLRRMIAAGKVPR